MARSYWQHYPHQADMGIRGTGPTKEAAFCQAALALTAIITDLKNIEPKSSVRIICARDEDDEITFINWLNALLCEMSTKNMLFSKFDISMTQNKLEATAWGETVDIKKHQPTVEVKAAT